MCRKSTKGQRASMQDRGTDRPLIWPFGFAAQTDYKPQQQKAIHFNNLYFDYRCTPFPSSEGGAKGALVLFTVGLKTFYLCTDLNPDQYKQYLLRPSAVTKPLFKAKKKNTQRITLNYEQKKKKKHRRKRGNNTVLIVWEVLLLLSARHGRRVRASRPEANRTHSRTLNTDLPESSDRWSRRRLRKSHIKYIFLHLTAGRKVASLGKI